MRNRSLENRLLLSKSFDDTQPENITVTTGGSEANYVTLWTLLEMGSRLACMIPNYMQAWGLGCAYADGVDACLLVKQKEAGQYRWRLDVAGLKRAVTPSLLSDHLSTIVMEPKRRESILVRTRHIIRKNLPPIEEWFLKRDDLFTYVRPEAGAFVYCEYKLPISSTELVNRLRVEQSVLPTGGDQHGLDKGIRTGFGFDVEKTLKGLDRAEALMRSLK